MKIKKRTEGKIKNCLGFRDAYKFYKNNYEDVEDYKMFSEIIKECNKELLNQIVMNSEIVDLPYRLGTLQISKFERSYNKPKNKLAVDWKKSKEHGFIIYHESDYTYKWTWKKTTAIFKNKSGYKFQANRFAKRMVPEALAKKIDYFR